MGHKKIICVDFDGVLHKYTSPWESHEIISDGPVPEALNWIRKMMDDGRFEIHIYSSRSRFPTGLEAMKMWFDEQGLEDNYRDQLKFSATKPAAFMTIDDRAFCFEGTFPDPDWIDSFKPWNKM